jgi:hypothetical protein
MKLIYLTFTILKRQGRKIFVLQFSYKKIWDYDSHLAHIFEFAELLAVEELDSLLYNTVQQNIPAFLHSDIKTAGSFGFMLRNTAELLLSSVLNLGWRMFKIRKYVDKLGDC